MISDQSQLTVAVISHSWQQGEEEVAVTSLRNQLRQKVVSRIRKKKREQA